MRVFKVLKKTIGNRTIIIFLMNYLIVLHCFSLYAHFYGLTMLQSEDCLYYEIKPSNLKSLWSKDYFIWNFWRIRVSENASWLPFTWRSSFRTWDEGDFKATLLKSRAIKVRQTVIRFLTSIFGLSNFSQAMATKIQFTLWIKPKWNKQVEAEAPILDKKAI